MTKPAKRKPAKRKPPHSKFPHRRQGLRNAAPNGARTAAKRTKADPDTKAPATTRDKAVQLLEAAAGAAAMSYAGAKLVQVGAPAWVASALVGVVSGGAALYVDREGYGNMARGGASVGTSQLLLSIFGPKPPPPRIVTVAAAPAPAPKPKNADLGTLPPGALDAAFERARAELAIGADGYPPSYAHDAFHHHPGV